MPATQTAATTRETTLTVTSPRTGITYSATAKVANFREGTYSITVGISQRNRGTVSVNGHIAADGTVKVGKALRMFVDARGHMDDRFVSDDEQAEIVAGVEFMWSKMSDSAKAMRMVSAIHNVMALRAEGDFDTASRIASRI